MSSSSSKRTADHLDAEQPPAKRTHPFFNKKADAEPSNGPFQWLEPLGSTRSCLHGVNLQPKPSVKVAAFDLDGTVIKSGFGTGKKYMAFTDWEWWRASVPTKLKEVVDSGYAVVLISNQALKPQAIKTWKLKIPLIAAALPSVPFRLFAATAKDGYRKPMPGMWTELSRIFRDEGVHIDRANSYFVGDAAGRQYTANKSDFSSTDRKWALNIGIPFLTPENYTLSGFSVSSLPTDLPPVTPTSSPLLPIPLKQELVLFVGYPCLGKSTFYRRNFEPAGYIHINQDMLKTRDKCVREMKKALQDGKSCTVDNTNRNIATRKHYLDVAKELGVPARVFNLPPTIAATEPTRELVPYIGFSGFRDNFEEPQLEEGFSEIKKVNWIFNGSAEERTNWSMWLQIDGK
ncbi:hypothetical protein DXG01_006576 [Tephrocybe rancida]|nr:hypothetical protein DXG01_006576 [Tephrocybe rancida]